MKLPNSFHNRLSYIGSVVVIVSLILMLLVYILSSVFDVGGNYTGLLIYMAIPGLLIVGLLLIPIGMLIRIRKIKKGEDKLAKPSLKIDLANSQHRNAVLIFSVGTVVFLIFSSIGSYQAFHYTESNEFCGTLCHQVMDPEFATYQTSAHARVKCVECHVGAGADWYVKSKMSGLYQVYAVLTNSYPHPIPTPITSLRPARETCEECHWPDKFYPNRIHSDMHYMADSLNTIWNIHYQMKIGPSNSSKGHSEGIHWHINPNVKIEYVESTPDREYIGFVRYINLETGDTTLYYDTEMPIDDSTLAASTPRMMDCMDCHNRPSHQFKLPQDFIDHEIAIGEIPAEIPEIKFIAMQLFNDPYDHVDSAYLAIENNINGFYSSKYPTYYKNNKALIDKSIVAIKKAYSANIFPEMKADWDQYPNHLGHVEYNGCFRCHDDLHVAENGNVIRKDCDLCHTILQQGYGDSTMTAYYNGSLEFKHPVDIDGAWKEDLCSDCHRYLYQ